ncbi:thiamine pyrophosphate-requiring protein [Pseudonocardia sp. C8]|uniref:thiamine pyrophosphate-requiring protein n=1 Tax=Pseudonocardia sp. C8 TaxID=2762759 RepID=UPI0016428657|nr:thiamine pyrophosphate-requiring protein [Pseudonocardia sp. C8]MBC3193754.1 thiamine pyrophosphate-requiring protein [Pseudonocardia sp. C8]
MQLTVATTYLARLAELGIESIFMNAGTDFAPIVEAYAVNKEEGGPTLPTPVLCAHENLAGGMAHGAALVSGRPQALMVHVSVGTANAACAVANASRDRVPLLVTAGRSPVLEAGATGARDLPIHWTQEMFDQAGLVRELVKWDYELRDARQVEDVVDRAVSVAESHPRGPVYLSLPREVLAEPAAGFVADRPRTAVPASVQPDPAAVAELADRIAAARFPVVVSTASGAERGSAELLGEVCSRFGIGVADSFSRFLTVSIDHPHHVGTDPGPVFAEADLIVFLECDVPWIEHYWTPRDETFIAQVAVDPIHGSIPMRSHRSDLNISATPVAFLTALRAQLETRAVRDEAARTTRIRDRAAASRDAVDTLRTRALEESDQPITKATISAVLGELLDDEDLVFNEYVGVPELLHRTEPGTYFFLPSAGGLGWGLPAALGAKYAAPDRTVVATLGDGAYLFANPAACHHAAAKHDLPVLTVIANNGGWWAVDAATYSVYPNGTAMTSAEERFSDLSPSPDFASYCTASGGHGVTVHHRRELRGALEEAFRVVRDQGRQALVDVRCS